jgi:PHD/YefM family antitoxin component YafN of YafNO toxin-antitoxin module
MVAYATNELIPSSQFAKQFGSYLAQIKESTVDKLAILKNNKVEAVLVSKDDYERMSLALETIENNEIFNIVEQRLSKPYKTISHEDMLKSLNIDLDELKN